MNEWEVCVECGSKLLTLANSSRVTDQKSLTTRFSPQGGCQCGVFADEVNEQCQACFPTELRCHKHPPATKEAA